jgi:hypothetical protein
MTSNNNREIREVTRLQLSERLDTAESAEEFLMSLPVEWRQLVLKYNRFQGRLRIAHRKTLAAEMGISRNALCIRVHYIRAGLRAFLFNY